MVHALKKAHVPVMWITVHSDKGHDAFLLEPKLFAPHLSQALNHQVLETQPRVPLRRERGDKLVAARRKR